MKLLSEMLRGITHELIKNPRSTLIILGILIALLGYTATNLTVDPSFDSLISAEGEFNTNARMLEKAFGTNTGFQIVYLLDETETSALRVPAFSQEMLEPYQIQLEKLLQESQYITAIGPLEISPSQRQARISVQALQPNTPDGSTIVQEEIRGIIAKANTPIGATVELNGFPVIIERVNTLIIQDNLVTILLTALLVFIVLYWYFRNIKLALIGVVSPLISLFVLGGMMVLLGVELTLTLAAVGVIVIGLGADYSIHVIVTYTRKLARLKNAQNAIEETLDELELALTGAYLTTVAGFAALMVGVSPSSQAQGTVLVIAITTIFIITMLLLPVLLYQFVKTAPESRRKRKNSRLETVFARLAHMQVHNPWGVLVFVLGLTVFFLIGAAQVSFSTSNSNWIPDEDPIAITFGEIQSAFGEEDTISVVLTSTRGDLRELQTVRDIQRLEAQLAGIPGVTRVESAVSGVALDNAIIHQKAQERKTAYNNDFTLTTIRIISEGFVVDESGSSLIESELRSILSATAIYQTETSLFGDTIRFSELGASLQADAAITTLLGFILVFVVVGLLYTSFALGTVALVPILLAILWAVGMKGYFSIPFTSLSTGIVSLVLGIGIDFSIHLVNAIKHTMQKHDALEDALTEALQTTGGAIILSTITTFFGFLALAFATLLGTQRLGWSLAFSIFSVAIVTLLLVPTIVVLRERALKRRA